MPVWPCCSLLIMVDISIVSSVYLISMLKLISSLSCLHISSSGQPWRTLGIIWTRQVKANMPVWLFHSCFNIKLFCLLSLMMTTSYKSPHMYQQCIWYCGKFLFHYLFNTSAYCDSGITVNSILSLYFLLTPYSFNKCTKCYTLTSPINAS